MRVWVGLVYCLALPMFGALANAQESSPLRQERRRIPMPKKNIPNPSLPLGPQVPRPAPPPPYAPVAPPPPPSYPAPGAPGSPGMQGLGVPGQTSPGYTTPTPTPSPSPVPTTGAPAPTTSSTQTPTTQNPGSQSSSSQNSGAPQQGEGFCNTGGARIRRWESVEKVASEVLRPNQGYNINANNWPTIGQDGQSVRFGPANQSMCTSATRTVFAQQVVDLFKANNQRLTSEEIGCLNSNTTKFGFNGNTFAPSVLMTALGGVSVNGNGANKMSVLQQAKPGDVLIYSRARGGHATIFKELRGNQVCFFSSQQRTNGAGEACADVSSLVELAVSRLPYNPQTIRDGLKTLCSGGGGGGSGGASSSGARGRQSGGGTGGGRQRLSSQSSANQTQKSDVQWAQTLPNCDNHDYSSTGGSGSRTPASTGGSPNRRSAAQ